MEFEKIRNEVLPTGVSRIFGEPIIDTIYTKLDDKWILDGNSTPINIT